MILCSECCLANLNGIILGPECCLANLSGIILCPECCLANSRGIIICSECCLANLSGIILGSEIVLTFFEISFRNEREKIREPLDHCFLPVPHRFPSDGLGRE